MIYKLLFLLFTAIKTVTTRTEVVGRHNVPSGACLVVANHVNLLDSPILGISLGRKVRFMAKEELFYNKIVGFFTRQFGGFPVGKGRLDRRAGKIALEVLAQGEAIVVFPEGKRSYQNQLTLALNGSALIAYHNKAPILPVGITGTEKIRGLGWILHRPEITLNIGRPFTLPDAGTALSREVLLGLTNVLMNKIAELLPPKYRGSYEGVKPKWPL